MLLVPVVEGDFDINTEETLIKGSEDLMYTSLPSLKDDC